MRRAHERRGRRQIQRFPDGPQSGDQLTYRLAEPQPDGTTQLRQRIPGSRAAVSHPA